MNTPEHPAKKSTNRVDWSDPRLEALLKKTEGWQLDNRGSFPPQNIEVQIGWNGDGGIGVVQSGRPGLLVWEQKQVIVIQTNFPIEQGEIVRIDRLVGDSVQTVWGILIESRPGLRTGDDQNRLRLHWINLR